MTQIHWVANAEQMAQLCTQLMQHTVLMLDTEFIRDKTYRPEPCVLQISANPSEAWLIDLHTLLQDPTTNWQPLRDLLTHAPTLKVLHSARQDNELFLHSFGVLPHPLFDTQLTASVCGMGEDLSYALLVQKVCGVLPDKSQRLTDWKQRPLDDEQMAYAAADVTYLHAVYHHICALPTFAKRQDFIAEEMAPLLDPATYESRPDAAWRRFRLKHETAQTITALKVLACRREQYAHATNTARSVVLRDDALLEVARRRPNTPDEVGSVRYMPKKLPAQTVELILTALHEAAQQDDAPDIAATEAVLSAEQNNATLMLSATVRVLAQQDNVPLRLYMGNNDAHAVEKLVLNQPDSLLFAGARGASIGVPLQQLLQGESVLHCNAGQWQIVPKS